MIHSEMSKRGILAQLQAHQIRHGFMPGAVSRMSSYVRVEGGTSGSGTGHPGASKSKRKGPNRTESEYGLILKAQFPLAKIRYEAYTLKLADGLRYTPDWAIEHPDGRLEFVEVKGPFIFSKALTKPRAAAELFPQRFTIAQKLKSGWEVTPLRGLADRSPISRGCA